MIDLKIIDFLVFSFAAGFGGRVGWTMHADLEGLLGSEKKYSTLFACLGYGAVFVLLAYFDFSHA